jgi:uncharacterized membrane protein YphA (DoxX/SURF4 family)
MHAIREYAGPSIAAGPHLRSFRLLGARLLVGGIFLVASVPKIHSPGAFADAVRAFHLLPPSLVLPFAFLLPWLELLVAVYLITGFMSRLGALGSIVLLGMFVVGLLDSLLTGNTAHACGCFGAAGHDNAVISFLAGGNTVTSWDVIRDVILAVLAGTVLWWGPGEISVEALVARHRQDDMEETAA